MNQVAAVSGALRIVLFGPPNAGKSSLLGAVAQAARTQEHLLGGRLQDRGDGLAELQRRVYEDRAQPTLEEVVPYPATFTPSRNGELRDLVLIDCDGRVASDILTRRHLERESGSLAREVLAADALLLAVDASASPAELDHHFAEFVKFLRHFESNRGRQSQTGGMPAFLVLTKCDLLAQPGDTAVAWSQRLEERKHQVRERFERFLAEERDGPVPFGCIDLLPWATAVKQPALANSAAKPKEPYGVAELFAEAMDRAKAYRQRRRSASRRLLAILAGTVATAGLMIGLAAAFVTTKRTYETNTLLRAVEDYRADEGQTPSQRLREPLQQKISVLTEIRHHADFERLPEETQQHIRARLDELVKYRDFKEQLRQVRQINQARTTADLNEIDLRLRQLVPPPEWRQTDAALLRQERLDDIKTIREEADKIDNWYRDLKKQADALWAFDRVNGGALAWSDWQQEVDKLLATADQPFFRPSDRLPGSARVDYATVMRLRQVDEAATDWLRSRRRLEDLRDLTAALGLAGNVPGRPSLLAIPPDITLDQARNRLTDLERVYRRWREWPSQPLPDAALAEVHRAAETSYRNLMPAGQKVVLNQLQHLTPDGRDTPELWRDLRSWLGTAADFRDWRELASYLARLYDAKADDPVNALASFLRQDRFELEIYSLVLTLPDDLKARPAGPLVLQQHAGAEVRPAVNYVVQGDGIQDPRRRVTRYTLVRQGPNVPIIYRPGDILWAEMPLTKNGDGRDRKLMWTTSRSLVFMFERLTRPPRLYLGRDNDGPVAEGVSLSVRPESGVPKVPDLVPATSLRKP